MGFMRGVLQRATGRESLDPVHSEQNVIVIRFQGVQKFLPVQGVNHIVDDFLQMLRRQSLHEIAYGINAGKLRNLPPEICLEVARKIFRLLQFAFKFVVGFNSGNPLPQRKMAEKIAGIHYFPRLAEIRNGFEPPGKIREIVPQRDQCALAAATGVFAEINAPEFFFYSFDLSGVAGESFFALL